MRRQARGKSLPKRIDLLKERFLGAEQQRSVRAFLDAQGARISLGRYALQPSLDPFQLCKRCLSLGLLQATLAQNQGFGLVQHPCFNLRLGGLQQDLARDLRSELSLLRGDEGLLGSK